MRRKRSKYLINHLLVLFAGLTAGAVLLFAGFRNDQMWLMSTGHTLIMTTGLWMFCKLYVEYLWRRYPWETSPAIHIVLEIVGIGIFTVGFTYLLFWLEEAFSGMALDEDALIQYIMVLLITFLITAIHEMRYFYFQWIHNFSRSVKLEKETLQAKYETLKTQINPHYLFNSLNSLVEMVDDNEEAVDYIQHLSGFLRYVLGTRDKDLVYMEEELEQLENYYQLQQKRFGNKLRLDIRVPDKYLMYVIPPLSLQMLLENVIKHNVISTAKPLNVEIAVKADRIVVVNNLQRKTAGIHSTGQGLANIRSRYKYYTGKEVVVQERADYFSVSLPLLTLKL